MKTKLFIFVCCLSFSFMLSAQTSGGQIRRKSNKTQQIERKYSNHSNISRNINQQNNAIIQHKHSLPTGRVNGFDAIDLGLSVRWASINIGAEEVGDLFPYGDPTGKLFVADKKKYPHVNITNTEWDMAKSNWGNRWRLPTKKEFKELIDKCKWQYTDNNGIRGYKIIGSNGNEIFLPFAGKTIDGDIRIDKKNGYYRSGDILSLEPFILVIAKEKYYLRHDPFINNGYSVRAVTD